MADSLAGDLKQHIFKTHANGPRRNARWVMNREWLNEARRIEGTGGVLYHPGLTISAPEVLLGIPIEVRADGGVPHLEASDG